MERNRANRVMIGFEKKEKPNMIAVNNAVKRANQLTINGMPEEKAADLVTQNLNNTEMGIFKNLFNNIAEVRKAKIESKTERKLAKQERKSDVRKTKEQRRALETQVTGERTGSNWASTVNNFTTGALKLGQSYMGLKSGVMPKTEKEEKEDSEGEGIMNMIKNNMMTVILSVVGLVFGIIMLSKRR